MKQVTNKTINRNRKKELKEKIQDETVRTLYHKSEEKRATAMAKKFGLPYVDLSLIPIDAETVTSIPEEEAKKAELAVIYKVGKRFQIAVVNPENYETKKILEKMKKMDGINYNIVIVSKDSLRKAWANYNFNTITETFEKQSMSLKEKDLTEFEKGIHGLVELKKRVSELQTTELFNIIIAGAIKTKASDVHIEPYKEHIRLRYRIDGVLQEIVNLPKKAHKTILSRIKMLSKMKLNISNIPQDGHFNINLENTGVNVRVSILPSNFGESIVMRLLPETVTGLQLDELGFNQYYLEMIEGQIAKPTGMILVTGPTGSGKTTTLYSFIRRINNPGIKVITLENPIEYKLEGISQTEVGEDSGMQFSDGLRAVVRQDPDVMMVGEIRDSETAEIAIQAALTGHLVFSTLHTNNAAGAIPRLLHLKVNPRLITPSINAIIAQRLVRRLCEHCKEEYIPAPETVEKIKKILSEIPKNNAIEIPKEIKVLYRSKGCQKCNFIGYSGRVGIFELFTITPTIEKIILGDTSSSKVMAVAKEEGMITMKEDGILKALKGETSLEEIGRVTGEIFQKEKFAKSN
ncbi:MAG: GspE/PulE family protein [Patescibacteria group bacterium]|nr:GspE/PulE family protein [Patescibacteria group bacterium]